MATFGEVFGLAFGLEGVSFFVEAIFIAIYVYGWDRLPPRAHFLTGIPIVISGFAGSFNVIAVNGWMNHPQGFNVVDGRVTDPKPFTALLNGNLWHELVHMYLAGYIVAGFIVAGVYASAWLKGRRDRYHRTGLVVALSFAALAAPVQVIVGDWAGRRVAETQPMKLAAMEGLQRTDEGRAVHLRRLLRRERGRGEVRHRGARTCSRCSRTTTRPRPCRASTPCRRRTARRSTSCASRSRPWSGIGTRCSRCSASPSRSPGGASGGCRGRRGSTAR